jgi:hypothetical protein
VDNSQIVAILTGPGAAIVLMVAGGRWLMKRLESADSERNARDARFEQLVKDNTAAMTSMQKALEAMVARPCPAARTETSSPTLMKIGG